MTMQITPIHHLFKVVDSNKPRTHVFSSEIIMGALFHMVALQHCVNPASHMQSVCP